MGWYETVKSPKLKKAKKSPSNTPEGLWRKCLTCKEILQTIKLEENFSVCPYCEHHYRIGAKERINHLIDKGTFQEEGENLVSEDPLHFFDKKKYEERLQSAYERSGRRDSTTVGTGTLKGRPVSLAVMDFKFMGGSMGVVTGEKMTRCFELALEKNIPAIIVSCSGGARMQEGILSLMQMAKISGARQRLKEKGLPFISLLTDPTTGGVAASFAMQGDLNLAEPNSLIGFAGPRVIEQSMRQKLPEGFQRAEFLRDHGMVDAIISRRDLKDKLSFYLDFFAPKS